MIYCSVWGAKMYFASLHIDLKGANKAMLKCMSVVILKMNDYTVLGRPKVAGKARHKW